jgi:hypothetical protein
MDSENQKQFSGFPPKRVPGNFWCYPQIVCLHWCDLVGSEQKVLDCILRHTWGFDKAKDRISLSQLEHGVGQIHHGSGLSKKQIIRALRLLEAKGFIKSVKSSRTNEYSLVIEEHQKQGTKVNKSSLQMSPETGDESIHITGDKSVHTIKSLSIEGTIEKIYELYLQKIFPGFSEVSEDEKPRLTKKAKNKIRDRLREFKPNQISKAIRNFSDNDWQMRNNGTQGIAWFFDSEDRIEKFLNLGKLDDFSTRNY